jgi:hypothetical protein
MTDFPEVTFAREWKYRTMQMTKTYPAGWSGKLPREQLDAAIEADALEKEKDDGDEGAATPRPARRARFSQG